MRSALVLGGRGTGLTTFVGLLSTAQVRLGIDESDEFRFHAERESIRQLETIYGELGAGRFPTRDSDWEERPLSFVFGFRHGKLRGLARRDAADGEFDTVAFQVAGMLTDEVAELQSHDAVLEPQTRQALRSQVVVPLIDASRLSPDPSELEVAALVEQDRFLSGTLRVLGNYLAAEPARNARRMFPLFVVTKTDAIHLDTLRRLDAPGGLPAQWAAEARRSFGGRLLRTYFPETAKFLEAPRRSPGLQVAPPEWYFSSLGTEGHGAGLHVQRRSITPVGGWEPVYPFEEYRSFIESLGRISHRMAAWPAIEATDATATMRAPRDSGIPRYATPPE